MLKRDNWRFDEGLGENNNLEHEVERRRRVAEVKAWGAVIEAIERARKHPTIFSIMLRLLALDKGVREFQEIVKAMGAELVKKGDDPLKTPAPIFTTQQINVYIETYNDIIEDIHSHLRKKNHYVTKFTPLEKLNKPTLNDVVKTFFIMGMNILQIMGYMVRWME